MYFYDPFILFVWLARQREFSQHICPGICPTKLVAFGTEINGKDE